MGLRQCNECEEMVDDARAFCQGCGSPLVAEAQRREPSRFELSRETQYLDQSMLVAILGDMGLDLSKPPETDETPVENTVPLQTDGVGPAQTKSIGQTTFGLPQHSAGGTKTADTKVKVLALALVLLFSFGLFAAAVLIHAFWLRPSLGFLLTFSFPA